MTIYIQLANYLADQLDFTANMTDFYSIYPQASKGTVRKTISRAYQKGLLLKIQRGTYKLNRTYREIIHTKKQFESHHQGKKHSWDGQDIETSCVGIAPAWIDIHTIEKTLNPILLQATWNELGLAGFTFQIERVEFNIMGTQWRNKNTGTYNPRYELSVEVTNNIGQKYTFTNTFIVDLWEFGII